MSYCYSLYQLTLESDIPLFNLPQSSGTPDVFVTMEDYSETAAANASMDFIYSDDRIVFPTQFALFTVTNGNAISIRPLTPLVESEITAYASYILGSCMGLLLAQRHMSAFHCSALVYDNKGIIVSGASGAGKSTTAKMLIEQGYHYLADDIATIDISKNCEILPGFPARKLCSDQIDNLNPDLLQMISEGRGKYSYYDAKNFCDKPVPAKYMFMLDFSDTDELIIKKETGIDVLYQILRCRYFGYIFYNIGTPVWDKVNCLKLAENVSFYTIYRPRTGNTAQDITKAIKNIVEETIDPNVAR